MQAPVNTCHHFLAFVDLAFEGLQFSPAIPSCIPSCRGLACNRARTSILTHAHVTFDRSRPLTWLCQSQVDGISIFQTLLHALFIVLYWGHNRHCNIYNVRMGGVSF